MVLVVSFLCLSLEMASEKEVELCLNKPIDLCPVIMLKSPDFFGLLLIVVVPGPVSRVAVERASGFNLLSLFSKCVLYHED
uniref:Uncharacterized protein n=1 Tax=Rhizophora mucronata TaxID=61149 RepID=A0A2P2NCU2_RHIMU